MSSEQITIEPITTLPDSQQTKARRLYEALQDAWDARTSYLDRERYEQAGPAAGQCTPTAFVVQDRLGGRLASGRVYTPDRQVPISHAFNYVDGHYIDLSYDQFDGSPTVQVPLGDSVFAERSDYTNNGLDDELTKRYRRLCSRLGRRPRL